MKNKDLIKRVMQTIAEEEEKKLKKNLLIDLPAVTVLVILIFISLKDTFSNLQNSEVIFSLQQKPDSFIGSVNIISKLFSFVIQQTTSGFFAITIVGIISLIFFLNKSEILNYPNKIKEIRKYKK